MNDADAPDARAARSALRHLYAAAGAQLSGDVEAVSLLLDQACSEVPLGDLLEAGTLSISELLRDIAESRRFEPRALVGVLTAAHCEISEQPNLFTHILLGAGCYLRAADALWSAEALCRLLSCPSATLRALTTTLAAALTWRARDLGVDPGLLVTSVCLGLARRDNATAPFASC